MDKKDLTITDNTKATKITAVTGTRSMKKPRSPCAYWSLFPSNAKIPRNIDTLAHTNAIDVDIVAANEEGPCISDG
jgi:ribosomal protein S11